MPTAVISTASSSSCPVPASSPGSKGYYLLTDAETGKLVIISKSSLACAACGPARTVSGYAAVAGLAARSRETAAVWAA
jgi:hypothetical protein